MKLGILAPGATFCTDYTERRGEVVGQGEMGTRVRWAGTERKVEIVKKAQYKDQKDKVSTFTAPARVEIVSAGTVVRKLSGNVMVGPTEVGSGQMN